jgi:hypothetical protein
MTLEQLRAIAVELGQEPGSLPPLAGGSEWTITVAGFGTIQIEPPVLKAGTPLKVGPSNLLTVDRPTKMSAWRLTTIRIPVSVFSQPEAEPATFVEATITLILRRGGDIVWTQTLSAAMQKEGVKAWVSNVTMGGDLQNPISLPTGKTLTLEGRASFSTNNQQTSFQIGLERTENNLIPVDGAIAYETVALTGHRTL